MTTPLETMHLYTKILTGMVLLLNIGLLISIRIGLKHASLSLAGDKSEAGTKRWASVRRQMMVLILSVVAINIGAMLANNKVVEATREIAAESSPTLPLEYMLSMTKASK
jgi:hypothetical protein